MQDDEAHATEHVLLDTLDHVIRDSVVRRVPPPEQDISFRKRGLGQTMLWLGQRRGTHLRVRQRQPQCGRESAVDPVGIDSYDIFIAGFVDVLVPHENTLRCIFHSSHLYSIDRSDQQLYTDCVVTDDKDPSLGSRSDRVIDHVKHLISSGKLNAGDRLPIEKDLAAELGVSRGSLREAVRSLAALGVLETRQGDGTYVTQLDPGSLLRPLEFWAGLQEATRSVDLLAVRRVLETESAGLAAVRLTEAELDELDDILAEIDTGLTTGNLEAESFINADAAFHRRIATASGNPALAALIESLMTRTLRGRLWRAITERDSLGEAHADHRAILLALRTRDAERARIRMAAHLLGVEVFASEHPVEDIVTTLPDAGDA